MNEKQNKEGLKASSVKTDRKALHFLVRFLVKAAAIASVIILVFTFVFGVDIYHGNEMHPSLKDGDLVITYKLGKYGLGDIVRYTDPVTGNSRFSRIVGLSGYYKLLLSNASVGSTVFFGSYEQDNDTANGKEDIEWIVLAKEGNKLLVISKYALDCQKYNSTYRHTDCRR